jgi:hypothetical protein
MLADVWTYYPEIKLSMGILFDCISKALDQSPFIVIQRRFLTKRTQLIACCGEQKHFVQSDIVSHMPELRWICQTCCSVGGSRVAERRRCDVATD